MKESGARMGVHLMRVYFFDFFAGFFGATDRHLRTGNQFSETMHELAQKGCEK